MTRFLVLVLSIAAIFALTSTAAAEQPEARIFVAHLSGDNEVPPRDTEARGVALFIADKDEDQISFRVVVSGIDNVVAGHIHCGAEGVNAPVGVTLFGPAAPGGGAENGILSSGVKMAPDPGNACGWTSIQQVIAAMQTGNTYTNVHTNDGVPPTNTGAGDFPGGEIRGQNRPLP